MISPHLPVAPGRPAADLGADLPDPAQRHGGLGDRRRRDLGRLGRRLHAAGRGAANRADLLRARRLAGALGDRVPHRPARRLRAGHGLGHRRDRHRLRPRLGRPRDPARPRLPVLRDVSAVLHRPARHRGDRRRLQPVRLPRDRLAVVVRADQPRPRPARADRLLPLPHHGDHRRHVLHHRRRPDVHDDRHAQHGRPGQPAARPAPPAHHRDGAGLPHRRPEPEAGAGAAALLAAQRLHLRAVGGERVPRRDLDQDRRLRPDPHRSTRCSAARRCSPPCPSTRCCWASACCR